MANNRIWVIAGVLVVIIVLVLGGLLGVKPMLDAAQTSNDEREGVEAVNAQHKLELVQLEEESTHLDEYTAAVAELRQAIPALDDLDGLTTELATLQTSTGVKITSFAPTDAGLFVPSVTAAAVTPATVSGSSFVKVQVKVTATGTRDQALAFVNGLQSGSRLFLVSDVSVTPPEAGVSTVSIDGLVYMLLDTPYVDPTAVAPVAEETAAAE
jgi:Tfp pilus assembly protein PilO